MLALFTLLAAAQAVSPAVADDLGSGRDAKPKLVCKSERLVGSMIPTRICRTAAQWATEERRSQEDLANQKRYGA